MKKSQVRPDGHISTTVAGDVTAAGRTMPELDAALRGDYGKDLQNPRISVVVKSFAPTRIYVAGEVNNPGEFINVGPTLTLSQAIARAGGAEDQQRRPEHLHHSPRTRRRAGIPVRALQPR